MRASAASVTLKVVTKIGSPLILPGLAKACVFLPEVCWFGNVTIAFSKSGLIVHQWQKCHSICVAHLAKATSGHAWFIVGAPHQKERDWWQKQLGGTVVLLNPGIQVCRQRAIDRGTPLALQGMDQWVRQE